MRSVSLSVGVKVGALAIESGVGKSKCGHAIVIQKQSSSMSLFPPLMCVVDANMMLSTHCEMLT